MRTEFEIKNRIADIINEMTSIRVNAHRDNYLIYSDESRIQYKLLDELAHLYWVLGESIPKTVFKEVLL